MWLFSKRTGYVLLALNVLLAVAYYDDKQWLSTAAAAAAAMVVTKLRWWSKIEG